MLCALRLVTQPLLPHIMNENSVLIMNERCGISAINNRVGGQQSIISHVRLRGDGVVVAVLCEGRGCISACGKRRRNSVWGGGRGLMDSSLADNSTLACTLYPCRSYSS